ncbi:unnamed protein product [Rhizophagus irregularis]|nr:unnamed protein product [Rhizophagus irregularis]
MGKSGFSVAIWEEGPLHYDVVEKKWMKESYKKVVLKYLSNLRNITDEFLNEAIASIDSYGISQNPNTGDYILVEWVKSSYEKVCLRYLYNSQNVTNEFINKVESYLTDEKYYGVLLKYLYNSQNINDTLLSKVAASIMESYGISQNPNTKEFILTRLKHIQIECSSTVEITDFKIL